MRSLLESRDDITHVDLDAQTPLPARLPSPRSSARRAAVRVLGLVHILATLALLITVMRGCR